MDSWTEELGLERFDIGKVKHAVCGIFVTPRNKQEEGTLLDRACRISLGKVLSSISYIMDPGQTTEHHPPLLTS